MGCPMFEKKYVPENPTKYPFQSLYRPWSWLLSSFTNIFIFAFILVLIYALIKRRWRNKRRQKFTYRRVICDDSGTPDEGLPRVTALVTGGSGCLGKTLVDNLIKDGGFIVHSLDIAIPARTLPGVASYISADVTSREDLMLAFKDVRPQAVFHVAALLPSVKYGPDHLYNVNCNGTQNIIDACREYNAKRMIYTSSCDVLISNDLYEVLDSVDETRPYPEHPQSPYASSKIAGEKVVSAANGDKLATCILRCAVIASPHSALFDGFLNNHGLYVGSGTNKRSLVDADACAIGHILAEKSLRDVNSVAAGQIYHLSGDDYVMKDMIGYCIDDSGYTIWGYPMPWSIPRWVLWIAGYFNVIIYRLTGYCSIHYNVDQYSAASLTCSCTFSGGKAQRELGWVDHPSWQDTVLDVVYKHEQNKKNQ